MVWRGKQQSNTHRNVLHWADFPKAKTYAAKDKTGTMQAQVY